MWTQIKTNEQVITLKINDLIIQKQSNETKIPDNLTGFEENINIYKIKAKQELEVIIEATPSNIPVAEFIVSSMTKTIEKDTLLDGTWWIR